MTLSKRLCLLLIFFSSFANAATVTNAALHALLQATNVRQVLEPLQTQSLAMNNIMKKMQLKEATMREDILKAKTVFDQKSD